MSKLKLKTCKETPRGLRSDAYIPTSPKLAREVVYCRIKRETLNKLLDDYDALLKVAKRAGYKIVQPSSVLPHDPVTDKDVPAFLTKNLKEPVVSKPSGKRKRVKL